MSTPTPQPDALLDDLLDLRAELQAAGFDAGPQRVMAARNLLLALAAQGRLPKDVREWKTWLGPVFCAAPGEQEEFYLRFDEWEKRRPHLREHAAQIEYAQADATSTTRQPEARRPDVRSSAFRRWFDASRLKAGLRTWLRGLTRIEVLFPLAFVVLLLAIAGIWLRQQSEQPLPIQVFSGTEEQYVPLPDAEVRFGHWVGKTDGAGLITLQVQLSNFAVLKNSERLAVAHPQHYPREVAPAASLSLRWPFRRIVKETDLSAKATPIILQRKPEFSRRELATPTPPPPPTPSPTPIVQTYDTSLKPWQIALIFAPLVLYALWLLASWLRKQALLEKLPDRGCRSCAN